MNGIQDLLHAHLFEQAPILGVVLDRDLRMVAANERFRQGFPDWEGKHCFETLAGRTDPCPGCRARRTFEDGRVRIGQNALSLSGRPRAEFITRVAAITAPGSTERTHAIWMASDISEAESLQRENEVLFERVPCYMAVLDRDLRIVRANRRMRETFGGRRGEHCYSVYKRRDEPCADCPALKVLEDGLEHASEHAGVTASGDVAHYVVTASALSTTMEGGRPVVNRVIEMSVDVTRQHQLRNEVLEAERLAAVGQTVAGLAHGIKNILMGMEGGVYIMRSGLRLAQPTRLEDGVGMLERNVGKISSLVKNLLAFSKGTVPHVAWSDPAQIARDVVELYEGTARQAGIDLRANVEAGIPQAPLDPSGMHTCLANLVSNAIDACASTPSGTGRVQISVSERSGALCFEVTDDGCGMDQEVRAKIFTTFFTTKGAGGTGLGLLMTRKIVQEHGGRIEVTSQPEAGTTFRILLPRDRLPRLPADLESPRLPAS